jgi:hypothetical protein
VQLVACAAGFGAAAYEFLQLPSAIELKAPTSLVLTVLLSAALKLLVCVALWLSRKGLSLGLFLLGFAIFGIFDGLRFVALIPPYSGGLFDLLSSHWGLLLLSPLAFFAGLMLLLPNSRAV